MGHATIVKAKGIILAIVGMIELMNKIRIKYILP